MLTDLDGITGLTDDGRGGVVLDIATNAGVQRWRYRLQDRTVIAEIGTLSAALAVAAPVVLDRQWVLVALLDRGIDHTGIEPAGLIGVCDTCATCGDPVAWCPEWVYRWPRLADHRGSL